MSETSYITEFDQATPRKFQKTNGMLKADERKRKVYRPSAAYWGTSHSTDDVVAFEVGEVARLCLKGHGETV